MEFNNISKYSFIANMGCAGGGVVIIPTRDENFSKAFMDISMRRKM